MVLLRQLEMLALTGYLIPRDYYYFLRFLKVWWLCVSKNLIFWDRKMSDFT